MSATPQQRATGAGIAARVATWLAEDPPITAEQRESAVRLLANTARPLTPRIRRSAAAIRKKPAA